jgi:hypothetical protein
MIRKGLREIFENPERIQRVEFLQKWSSTGLNTSSPFQYCTLTHGRGGKVNQREG